ncbi:MAG: nucleotidyltransferase domain-containing protein [Candidatus Hydrogenedentes bacterium]|nr:nucleotidyltransferase domain-containing protein [Candidatus Hydrogenedentota bacterium]
MNAVLKEKNDELMALCRRHKVARLELFGSATSGAFESGRSDLDFLVSFEVQTPEEHADSYFGLLADLEDLFERRIDLVETKAIDNPYFLKAINSSRTLIYEG